jgi:hypothetical protein
MDAPAGELGGHQRKVAGGHARDQADRPLIGVDVLEFVDAEDLGGQGSDLVGRHHP